MRLLDETKSERKFTIDMTESELMMLWSAHNKCSRNEIINHLRSSGVPVVHTLGDDDDNRLNEHIQEILGVKL